MTYRFFFFKRCVDREGRKIWMGGVRMREESEREMTFMRLKLCSVDINIWACYSFFASFTFPEHKKLSNQLTTQTHNCSLQPKLSVSVNAASQHNMHKERTNI